MNQSSPPPVAVSRLPVLLSVREAYRILLAEPGLLLRAIAAPYLLSIMIAVLTIAMPASPFVSFLMAIAGLIPYVIFGVAWGRLTLLGPEAGRPSLIPSWSMSHWRYFGYLVVLAISAFSLIIPPLILGMSQALKVAGSTAPGEGMAMFLLAELAVIFGTVYLAARLSFVFPAAAVNEIYGWRHAWAHTRRQGMRLLGVIVFSAMPVIVVLWALAQMLGVFVLPEIDTSVMRDGASPEAVIEKYLSDNAGLIITAQAAMTGMSYLVMAVVMSAISAAFRIGTGWVPAVAPPLARV